MNGSAPETTQSPSRATQPRPWRRLHASTYVVLLLPAAVLFLLNVPGQYVPYVGMSVGNELHSWYDERMVRERLEHGWPYTYLVRSDRFMKRSGEPFYRPTAIWSFTEDFGSFSAWPMAGDVLVAFCLMFAVGLLAEYWRRQRRAIWQLRITDLLGLTALVAGMSWYAILTLRDYQHELEAMRSLRLHIIEDTGPGYSYADDVIRTRGGPSWLRPALDERFPKYFDRLVDAKLFDYENVERLTAFKHLKAISLWNKAPYVAFLSQFKNLEGVSAGSLDSRYIEPERSSDALDREFAQELGTLLQLPKLCFFQATGDGVGDRSAEVIASFPRLRILSLTDSSMTHAGLTSIAQCSTLEVLILQGAQITDSGLVPLAELPRLQTLDLRKCSLTDAALEHVGKISTLRRLELDETLLNGDNLFKLAALTHLEFLALPESVNRKAVYDLQRRMPQLKIEVGFEPFLAAEP